MHKKFLLVFCLLFLVGCKQVVDDDNYIDKVYSCLTEQSITNDVSLGYKYYIPKGVKKIKDYDYNQVFLVDDFNLYLYVDIISFFYKEELKRTTNEFENYYKAIDYNGKIGDILVAEEEDYYYLSIIYNYSRIESYVPKDKINKAIILSSIILNSIEYNDNVIEKVLEGDLGQFSEFTYEVNKPEGASSNFSQYLEEYVHKSDTTEQLPDE